MTFLFEYVDLGCFGTSAAEVGSGGYGSPSAAAGGRVRHLWFHDEILAPLASWGSCGVKGLLSYFNTLYLHYIVLHCDLLILWCALPCQAEWLVSLKMCVCAFLRCWSCFRVLMYAILVSCY